MSAFGEIPEGMMPRTFSDPEFRSKLDQLQADERTAVEARPPSS